MQRFLSRAAQLTVAGRSPERRRNTCADANSDTNANADTGVVQRRLPRTAQPTAAGRPSGGSGRNADTDTHADTNTAAGCNSAADDSVQRWLSWTTQLALT